MSALKKWRSLMYVPGHREDFISKAHLRGADAVILDLEDGVPAAEKEHARSLLPQTVERLVAAGTPVAVRINRPWLLAWKDLTAVAAAPVSAILLPKLDSVHRARVVDEVLNELALGPTEMPIVGIVETARGLEAISAILAAVPRIGALIPGNEDLAFDLGVEPAAAIMEPILIPLVVAAHAHRVRLLGTMGGNADLKDLEGYRQRLERARTWGFVGATCIHPSQISIVHAVFQPREDEINRARRIVDAFESSGEGAVVVDGGMVDRPVYLRARRLLETGEP